jgi:ubiquinone/menaquinone biosynthesis C-methylase UbiE
MHKPPLSEHTLNEYRKHFDMSEDDLNANILEHTPSAAIPLPYPDFSFDFVLVSHYLFTKSAPESIDVHVQLIRELARVAKEVRIAPLTDTAGKVSEILGPVLLALQQADYGVEVREIAQLYPEKGNAMLRVWAQLCVLSKD